MEASDAHAHSKLLEAENTRLKHEVAFLRDNPEPTQAPRQVTELSLALRRVSDKLLHTEDILVQRNTELAQAISEKLRLQHEVEATRAEADRIRETESEIKSRERDLQQKCKAAEEEARMADTVVMEYADLVRSLECRIPKSRDTSGGTDDEHQSELVSEFRHVMSSDHSSTTAILRLLCKNKIMPSYILSLRIGFPCNDFFMNLTPKPLVFNMRSHDSTANSRPFKSNWMQNVKFRDRSDPSLQRLWSRLIVVKQMTKPRER